jgi:hypothetical protein
MEPPMKVFVTIDLDNRLSQDADLLEACLKDGVVTFNRHTSGAAHISNVRMMADDVYETVRPHAPEMRFRRSS